MQALVDVTDFGAWIGQDLSSPADSARAQAYLVSASALVRSFTGRTWADADGNLMPVPDEVATVVKQAAERKWVNPSGATWQTIGPMSVGHQGKTVPGIYLVDEDKEILGSYTVESSGLWTLGIDNGYCEDDSEDFGGFA